jgi:dual specificity MAP kinase phosphatase
MLEPKGRNDGHIFDFSKITDQIYIGSDLCKGGVCLIHGEEFRKLGVSFEINLSRENNELPPKDMEIGYAWFPVTDGYAPTQEQLEMGAYMINSAVSAGKKVFVHCKNGHGRSPTLVAAYLMKYARMSMEDALKLIKEKREEVHIEDAQMETLEKFGKTIND